METKSFVIGAVCGALIFATASHFLADNNGNTLIETPNRENSPSTGPFVAPPSIELERQSDSSVQKVARRPESEINETEYQSPIGGGASDRFPRWPGNIQGVIEAEPKDDSWAYYMEHA